MPTTGRDLSTLNLSELRALTGAGERKIRRRLEGLKPAARDGRTLWYPAREALSRVFLGEELDLSRERARLAAAQAEKVEMQNAELRGELVRGEDVEGFGVPLLSAMVQRLRALAAKAAPEVHGAPTMAQCQTIVARYVEEALAEVVAAIDAGVARAVGRVAARRRRAKVPPETEPIEGSA